MIASMSIKGSHYDIYNIRGNSCYFYHSLSFYVCDILLHVQKEAIAKIKSV
jgi:hypothetical protein